MNRADCLSNGANGCWNDQFFRGKETPLQPGFVVVALTHVEILVQQGIRHPRNNSPKALARSLFDGRRFGFFFHRPNDSRWH